MTATRNCPGDGGDCSVNLSQAWYVSAGEGDGGQFWDVPITLTTAGGQHVVGNYGDCDPASCPVEGSLHTLSYSINFTSFYERGADLRPVPQSPAGQSYGLPGKFPGCKNPHFPPHRVFCRYRSRLCLFKFSN